MDMSDHYVWDIGLIVLAYLMGSIPFAILWSKAFGLADPRKFGSGNPGATNVLRSGNKTAAVLTLLCDALKGWFAVWLATAFTSSGTTVAFVAVAVFLGHLYPVFLKFRGGKGVATALGILIAMSPWLGGITLLTWILVAYVSKMSSLAAVISAVLAPVYYVLGSDMLWPLSPPMVIAVVFMGLMLLYRHASNIARIIKGTETRIGSKSAEASVASKTVSRRKPAAARRRGRENRRR